MGERERRPQIDKNGVPNCTYDGCPKYDGKRCEETGFRAGGICEPAVIDMHANIREVCAIARNQALFIRLLSPLDANEERVLEGYEKRVNEIDPQTTKEST